MKALEEQVKANDLLKTAISDHTSRGYKSFTFYMQGDQMFLLSADEAFDDLKEVNENEPELMQDIVNTFKGILGKPKKAEKLTLKSNCEPKLPKLKWQFQGRHWSDSKSRAHVQLGMVLHGFGKGVGRKKYKPENMPEWMPEEINVNEFVGACHLSRANNDLILERMYGAYGIDIKTYCDQLDLPKKPKKVAKKPKCKECKEKGDEVDVDFEVPTEEAEEVNNEAAKEVNDEAVEEVNNKAAEEVDTEAVHSEEVEDVYMDVVTNKDLLGSHMVVVDGGTEVVNNSMNKETRMNMVIKGSEDSVMELEDNWNKETSNDDEIELEESWDKESSKEDELTGDEVNTSDKVRKTNFVVKINSQSQVRKKVPLDESGVVTFRRSSENLSECVLDDTIQESTPTVKAKRQKKE